ncbi:hypothetical protein BCR34DRAFT_570819 [Clohesyomyces aquaticus]|uniref:Sulfatase N-terminal domain-containing protein n=1 Tax=Clohesyomyces aquaticus TaxID=1231657 RepID=A0A1Y1ZAV7_9PLEO|nr:hypothetical protein BCR34DRAFT_570819 [Clohesyomyces aquaticus]
MYTSLVLTVSGLLTITAAVPAAHTDKLFMLGFDDVGRIYSEPNFKGASAHILSATDVNKCVPLIFSETGAP